jgi:hypothetical protein
MRSRFVSILINICLTIVLCLPASVGANQVLAYQTQPESLDYENMQLSPGDLTLHGQFYYHPRDSTQYTPAKYYLVGIYTPNTNQPLAFGHTNDAVTYATFNFPSSAGTGFANRSDHTTLLAGWGTAGL